MVIVTTNQYILASRINHILLQENVSHIDVRNKQGKYVSIKNCEYLIDIWYVPESASNPDKQQNCTVTLKSRVDAHKVFKSIVEQIREQMPDTLYLREALEKMLAGSSIENNRYNDDDEYELSADSDPRKSKKPQKAKKANKARKSR